MADFIPVFGSFLKDFFVIFVLGAVGGIIFSLLLEKGLTFPFKVYENEKVTMINFGFLADVIIGGMAATLVYALNPPVSQLTFVVIGVISGVGGKAVLTGYIKSKDSEEDPPCRTIPGSGCPACRTGHVAGEYAAVKHRAHGDR